MAKRSKPAPLHDLVSFHREAIDLLLSLCAKRGIQSPEQLNAFKGRALLDVPIWKLLETAGKYGGPYVSAGVRALELRLGKAPSISRGKWPELLLVQHLGPAPTHDGWTKHPDYCCNLDHVHERENLIEAMLAAPQHAQEILDQCLLGCVVLRREHGRLGEATLNPKDPWQRYREATPPIQVWDRVAASWVSLAPRL